jgi:hypothetical protein
MRRIKPRVNVCIAQPLLTKVVEDVTIHELPPSLAGIIRMDAVIVDVPITLFRKQVKTDESEYFPVL